MVFSLSGIIFRKMHYCIFFLLVLQAFQILVQTYNIPDFGKMIICDSAQGLESVMTRLRELDIVVIGIISDYIPHDSYLALYLGKK